MAITCIDISYAQGNIDFTKVKAAGVNAVIIRAGYGSSVSQKDNYFEQNYKNAKAAGLKIGAYWYAYAGWNGSDPIQGAKNEAAACLACIKGKSFDLPIYYDIEEAGNPNMTRFGKAKLTRVAETFCEAIKAGGFRAGVYSGAYWFTHYIDYAALKAKYSIWLAQWYSTHELDCDIWQYSDNGVVNGIIGNVDADIIVNPAVIKGGSKPDDKPAPKPSGKADIKAVQKWLNANYKTGLAIDGIYGAKTRAALVKALQTELNKRKGVKLAVDGVFGAKTYSAIPNVKNGAQGKITKVLQGLLICNGYNTGGFDGVFGNQTEKAVKAYQNKKGLAIDGIAGKNTFKALCT